LSENALTLAVISVFSIYPEYRPLTFVQDSKVNVITQSVDKDNSADATHNEYDYDPIKQAKSDLKKKTQPIPDIAEMDFKFDEKVDYRQKFSQSKKVLFHVKALGEEYPLTLERSNVYTGNGDWYSGYIENTDITARVKAFSDKVAIYIYEPERNIKISKTLNERQKYIDNKYKSEYQNSQSPHKTEDKYVQSNFYETKNDYYIINERADDTYENELYYNKINPNGVSDYNDAPLFPTEKNQCSISSRSSTEEFNSHSHILMFFMPIICVISGNSRFDA
jgi:hypothetical protein